MVSSIVTDSSSESEDQLFRRTCLKGILNTGILFVLFCFCLFVCLFVCLPSLSVDLLHLCPDWSNARVPSVDIENVLRCKIQDNLINLLRK